MVVVGGRVTCLCMLIGDSADDKKTCICTRDSRANVEGLLGGRQRQNEVVLGGRVTSLHMLIGDSADEKKTCICTRDSRANVGGLLGGEATK